MTAIITGLLWFGVLAIAIVGTVAGVRAHRREKDPDAENTLYSQRRDPNSTQQQISNINMMNSINNGGS